MKLKLTVLLLLLAGCVAADNSVSIRIGGKTWSFTLPVAVSSLTCDKTMLLAGDKSTCTITIDMPAPAGGFAVTPYGADAPLTLFPAALTVPEGATTASFVVSRVAPATATPATRAQ